MSTFEEEYGDWAVDVVTIQARLGSNGRTDVFAEESEMGGLIVSEKVMQVVTGDGRTLTSTAMILCPLDRLTQFPDGSKVTLPSGRTVKVQGTAAFTIEDSIVHGEVACA